MHTCAATQRCQPQRTCVTRAGLPLVCPCRASKLQHLSRVRYIVPTRSALRVLYELLRSRDGWHAARYTCVAAVFPKPSTRGRRGFRAAAAVLGRRRDSSHARQPVSAAAANAALRRYRRALQERAFTDGVPAAAHGQRVVRGARSRVRRHASHCARQLSACAAGPWRAGGPAGRWCVSASVCCYATRLCADPAAPQRQLLRLPQLPFRRPAACFGCARGGHTRTRSWRRLTRCCRTARRGLLRRMQLRRGSPCLVFSRRSWRPCFASSRCVNGSVPGF